ncbi:TetR family transcriptional regulator [Bacillus toyonensis]|nr:TetR family transcriptional regulator [Bacillus toyonensis]PHA85003.1 TetR family transcriptional regulator [Bacillus toyonensis]PHB31962.1 TetR family transcriptional regulator [Bacillus toyonensis]QWI08301.1 TetR family transcriptional regulator [Bacillus toyonensis]
MNYLKKWMINYNDYVIIITLKTHMFLICKKYYNYITKTVDYI